MRTDGRKDMKKLMVAFRIYANAYKIGSAFSPSAHLFILVSGSRNSFAGTPSSWCPIAGRGKTFYAACPHWL